MMQDVITVMQYDVCDKTFAKSLITYVILRHSNHSNHILHHYGIHFDRLERISLVLQCNNIPSLRMYRAIRNDCRGLL